MGNLKRRGPDCIGYEIINIDEDFCLLLVGSTLHIRGCSVTKQPLKDLAGNVLLWNGEIFSGISVRFWFISVNFQNQIVKISLKYNNL